MKKTLTTLAVTALAISSSQAVQIFMDDFEGYAAANPAAPVLDQDLLDPDNITWTPSSTATDAHRVFNSNLYGVTRLWISNIDGTSLNSSGLALENDTTYTLEFFAGIDTSRAGRSVDFSVDVLVGQSFGSATSVLGGPQLFQAVGDNDVTPGTKDDQMFQQSFDTATVTPGDQMFLSFTRVGITSGFQGGWFAIDDVSIDATAIPEPSSSALFGLGALSCLLRRRR